MEHLGFIQHAAFFDWHDFLIGLIVYAANYFGTKHAVGGQS